MGALHQGHISLIKAARKAGDILVISIFVNPTQFGPKEDYKKYPRPFNKDKKLAEQYGVDIIFYPPPNEMYPKDYSTYVSEEKLSKVMCGKARPGHFGGVTTIVLKLFNIVQPDIVFFGQKDFQQATVIRKIVRDLNLPVKIKILPIIRTKDGLALSSRNKYLSHKERKEALNLYKSLQIAAKTKSLAKGRAYIKQYKQIKLDYFVAVNKDTLAPVKKNKKGTLMAIAARIGKTRLIDNIVV